MNPWDAERVVDGDRAATLIAEQFPTLAGEPVQPLGVGWDNTVHLVGGRRVFRFPRREIVLAGVAREIAVLPWLAPQLPLAVPVPTYIGSADGWPFWGGPLVPGEELTGLPEEQRLPAAAEVGRFLRALHAVVVPPELRSLLPVDPMRRAEPSVRAVQARAGLSQVDPDGEVDATPLLDEAAALGPSTAVPVLVHGDLHVRHVLVDGAHASGVIDWGDVCLADPAVDLSLAYTAFAGRSRAALLSAYGEVGHQTELRARVLGLSLSTMLAAYAHDTGDAALAAESLSGLRRCVS